MEVPTRLAARLGPPAAALTAVAGVGVAAAGAWALGPAALAFTAIGASAALGAGVMIGRKPPGSRAPAASSPEFVAAALADERAAREEVEAAQAQMAFLSDAGLVLATSLDVEETLARVARLAVPTIADWCSVTLKADNPTFRPLAVAHVDPEKVQLAERLQETLRPQPDAPYGVPHVLRTGQPELAPTIPPETLAMLSPAEREVVEALGLVSAMTVPIVVRGEVFGVLSMISAESGRHYGERDLALAEDLALRAAVALDNARLYQEATSARAAQEALAADLERRVAERTAQLEVANQELEAFAYSVSHDLRAPLRAIDGFGQALEEDYAQSLNADGRDYLKRVRAATRRMGELIEDLLQFSRLTRGEMAHAPVDFSAIARDVAAAVHQGAPDRVVDWRIEGGMVAEGDERLLRVVLENLLGNAFKFTGRHETARIEVFSEERDGRRVYCVRDDGAGFDMAYAQKLFNPFQRLHAASDFPGTGVGLATVQRIVHRHGGRIWAEAMPERGASFCFTLA